MCRYVQGTSREHSSGGGANLVRVASTVISLAAISMNRFAIIPLRLRITDRN